MDWQTIFTVGIVLVFIIVMMRGCGGMMRGGGCGIGRDQSCETRPKQPDQQDRSSGGKQ